MTLPVDPSPSAPSLSRRGLLGAGLGLAAAAAAPARAGDEGDPLWVFAVRHAEKQAGDDPLLTDAGAARAEQLATALRDVPLQAVYSTDTRRTRATATPVARGHGLEVTTYEPKAGELARTLGGRTGAVLVVGHSNTIPALVRELGGQLPATELEGFDDLFVLVRLAAPAGGAPRAFMQHLHHGAASAAGPMTPR